MTKLRITFEVEEDGAEAAMRLCALYMAAPDILAALERAMVGITKQSTSTCDWYEGIEYDAAEEARAAIQPFTGKDAQWLANYLRTAKADPAEQAKVNQRIREGASQIVLADD